jgi:hypothetical protein
MVIKATQAVTSETETVEKLLEGKKKAQDTAKPETVTQPVVDIVQQPAQPTELRLTSTSYRRRSQLQSIMLQLHCESKCSRHSNS